MRENPDGDPALSVPSVALSGAVVSFFVAGLAFFFCALWDVMVGTLWWWRFFFGVLGRYGGKSNERHRTKKHEFNIKKGKI